MLLRALRDLARDPKVAIQLPREGYKKSRVRYKVKLDRSGRLVGLFDLAEGTKPPGSRGTEMEVPTAVRTSAVKPLLFADGPDYTFGLAGSAAKPTRVAEAHRAYSKLADECAAELDLPEVTAVVSFLASGVVPDGIDPTADAVCFEVGDRLVTDLPEVVSFWTRAVRGKGTETEGQCLVCGERRPILSRWPVVIKGIPGGQSSGNQLVSANAPAFESFGLEASAASPACFDCARESALGLNWLLSQPGHHIRTSAAAVFVFWTRGGDPEFSLANMMSDPSTEDVKELLRAPQSGHHTALDLEDTRFLAACLTASGSRIAVRSWIDTSLAQVRNNLAAYFRAQSMVQPGGADPVPIALRRLILATTRDERDAAAANPGLGSDLLAHALVGSPLPAQTIAAVLRRIRSEQKTRISHPRAVLLKLALASSVPDPEKEKYMQRLDAHSDDRAYLCGRLLAELEAVQRAALGNPKASLTDRYFGAASSAPSTVFGPLLRNAQHHLARLRKERFGTYLAIDRRIQDISSRLTSLPNVLTMKEQAVFALGYYHQKAEDRAAASAARDAHLDVAVEQDEEGERNA